MNTNTRRLIDAYLDRTISGEELAEFQAILVADREARDAFRALAIVDSFLTEQAAGHDRQLQQWFAGPVQPLACARPRTTLVAWSRRIGLIAATILLGVIGWSLALSRPAKIDRAVGASAPLGPAPLEPAPLEKVEPPLTFATIVAVDGAASLESGPGLAPGRRVAEQVLRLSRGAVQIEFDSGVTLTLIDRGELHVKSAASANLISGRLLFRNDRPNSTFDLRTPLSELVDLGTSYGVSIRDDFEEVHVFDGEVWRASKSDPEATVLMDAGYARRFGHDLPPFGEAIPLDNTAAPLIAAVHSSIPPDTRHTIVFDDFSQYGGGTIPANAVLAGGRGWAEPWRWHARDSDGQMVDNRELTIRDGMVVESGNMFLNRKLAEPIRLDRDGTTYFRVRFRMDQGQGGEGGNLFVVLRGSEEPPSDVAAERLVTLVSMPTGQIVTRLGGQSELQRLALAAGRDYHLVGRIDARRSEPDRLAVAVLPSDAAAWRSEPSHWANFARPVECQGVLDLFALHVHSQAAVRLGEIRLAQSWSDLAGE